MGAGTRRFCYPRRSGSRTALRVVQDDPAGTKGQCFKSSHEKMVDQVKNDKQEYPVGNCCDLLESILFALSQSPWYFEDCFTTQGARTGHSRVAMMFPLASLNMLGISAAEDDAEGSAAAEDSFGGEAIPAPTLHNLQSRDCESSEA